MDSTLVKFSGIRKSYPGKDVLLGVNFNIKSGSIHGFLGPNGAGKSTLMNILLGEIENDSGEVSLTDETSIGYLPEHPPLYMNMKVWDYLCFVQDIYTQKDRKYLKSILAKCGLEEVKDRMIGHLSKGYKQRVGLAQAVCHKPDLLVLDEPMVGLDPHAIIQMKDLIKEFSKEHTIFISSHQLHELSQICDHITILHQGVVVKDGTINEIETSLNSSQIVEVEFESSDQGLVEGMCQKEKISIKKLSGTIYQFSSNDSACADLRPVLSKFFLENNIAILSQKEVKMDLEEIFKSATTLKQEAQQ
jgi:ABC-2 type transport system ATP-binding protein